MLLKKKDGSFSLSSFQIKSKSLFDLSLTKGAEAALPSLLDSARVFQTEHAVHVVNDGKVASFEKKDTEFSAIGEQEIGPVDSTSSLSVSNQTQGSARFDAKTAETFELPIGT